MYGENKSSCVLLHALEAKIQLSEKNKKVKEQHHFLKDFHENLTENNLWQRMKLNLKFHETQYISF